MMSATTTTIFGRASNSSIATALRITMVAVIFAYIALYILTELKFG